MLSEISEEMNGFGNLYMDWRVILKWALKKYYSMC
jgi:hypothetical protein